MPRMPLIRGQTMVGILEDEGFYIARIKGSHFIMEKILDSLDVLIVHVPVHRRRPLAPGTLGSIMRRSGINRQRVLWYLGR